MTTMKKLRFEFQSYLNGGMFELTRLSDGRVIVLQGEDALIFGNLVDNASAGENCDTGEIELLITPYFEALGE